MVSGHVELCKVEDDSHFVIFADDCKKQDMINGKYRTFIISQVCDHQNCTTKISYGNYDKRIHIISFYGIQYRPSNSKSRINLLNCENQRIMISRTKIKMTIIFNFA